MVIRIEKFSGTSGVESFIFDKVKFENSKEKTPYIESEETTSVQVGQRYANSLLIGNQYGLEVIDDMNNTRVRIGQYRPNKYGIEVHGGAIEFIGGLPIKQVDINIGGRNLIVRSGELANTTIDTNGGIIAFDGSSLMASDIQVVAGESLMFSQIYNGNGDSLFRYAFYAEDQTTLIEGGTNNATVFQVTVPNGATLLKVSYDSDNQVKLERGNVATGWTPSPEDVDNKIVEGINDVTTQYNAAIEAKADEINLAVSQTILDSEGSMREYIGTQVQTTEDSFNIKITEINTTTEQHETDIAEMHSYFRFDPTGLNIGKSDSPLQINISNEQMDFIDNGSVIAYVNGQKMYIDSLEVLTNLIVGNHKIEKYDSNITLIKWVGE